jgi:hypothetical protein
VGVGDAVADGVAEGVAEEVTDGVAEGVAAGIAEVVGLWGSVATGVNVLATVAFRVGECAASLGDAGTMV